MRKLKKYTYYIYLIVTIGLFLGIITYILIVRSTYDNVSQSRFTVFESGEEAKEVVRRELTHYFSIRTEADWKQRYNNTNIVDTVKQDLYGQQYNYLFFSKNPQYRVLDYYISLEAPYIVTIELELTTTESLSYYTVQAVVEDNKIIDIKVF